MRTARPAASSGLPALAARSAGSAPGLLREPTPIAAMPTTAPNTVANAKPNAVVALPMATEDSAPILPPRPTGRMQASGTRTAGSAKWPYIVIGLAVVAIAAAIVLMVLPKDDPHKDPGVKGGTEMPAPDRMNTDPHAVTPVPTPTDPNGPHAQVTPPTPTPPGGQPNVAPGQPVQPPDIDDIPPPDIDDPLGQNLRNPFQTSPNAAAMLTAMIVHACDRLDTCPGKDPMSSSVCSAVKSSLGSGGAPPTCDAASRCLSKIDSMTCTDLGDPDDLLSSSFLMSMATSVQDCMSALRC